MNCFLTQIVKNTLCYIYSTYKQLYYFGIELYLLESIYIYISFNTVFISWYIYVIFDHHQIAAYISK